MFNNPVSRPFDKIRRLGVVIRFVKPPQSHCGILYHLDDEDPKILHLAWHKKLCCEAPSNDYLWADVGLDDYNQDVIAATFANMMVNAGDVSYGLDSNYICFDADGTYRAPPAGKGLTCATFIVAVFRSHGYEICDQPTWPDRGEDQVWQNWVTDMMERTGVEPEHINLVRQDIGAKRFKPDEVVASASMADQDWPIKFQDARTLADQIMAELNAAFEGVSPCPPTSSVESASEAQAPQ